MRFSTLKPSVRWLTDSADYWKLSVRDLEVGNMKRKPISLKHAQLETDSVFYVKHILKTLRRMNEFFFWNRLTNLIHVW